jgi:transcriptional regulator GlxA family with amidase domain
LLSGALHFQDIAGLQMQFLGLRCRALVCALVKRLAAIHASTGSDPRVERAIRFFDQRFAERVTMDAAARIAGLSPDHFFGVFRSAVGCTPH